MASLLSSAALFFLPLLPLLAAAAHFPELRRPPEGEPPPELAPPWHEAAPGPPASPAAWEPVRQRLERRWRDLMGPFPPRVPPGVDILAREEQPDHARLRIRYRTEAGTRPDSTPEAYLLLPRGFPGRRPGMVVLHQTTNETIEQPAGRSGRESMHLGLHLVRRGYACILPRNFLWSRPAQGYQAVTQSLLARPPEPGNWPWRTGMAKMTWDALIATDVLAARPEVDPARIGSIGHSLGGKEALYHAAFDPRVQATVSCEGGVGLAFTNWEADWYLGRQVRDPGFRPDHHEVLALAAPRPFLLIGGESADGAKSWPYIHANLPVWRLWNAEERLGLLRHRHGHDFPPPGPDRDLVYRWLDHWLRP